MNGGTTAVAISIQQADMENLTGLVLCGGMSTRMGKDKGLIKSGNDTWAEIIFKRLSKVLNDVKVSINSSQTHSYEQVFKNEKLIIDAHENAAGPLKGLLSAFQKFPTKDFLIVACDMQNVEDNTIASLLSEYKKKSNEDFIAYKSQELFEPLIAIYKSVGLRKILNSGLADRKGLQYFLQNYSTLSLPIDPSNLLEFTNYNSPGDLNIK